MPDDRTPLWVSLLGGAGAGATVIGFLALPWPVGLLVVPLLAGWTLLITGSRGRTAVYRMAALIGVIALGLGAALAALLTAVS